MYLNYTRNAQLAHKKLYKGAYGESISKCYENLESGSLSIDTLLWYQAFEGFTLLSNSQFKDRLLAAELRRYVFRKKLNGTEEILAGMDEKGKEIKRTIFRTGDGSIYNALTDDELIDRMVAVIQKSYRDKHIEEDENALEIHIKPNIIKKRFLIEGQAERRPLIRCAFALSMNRDEFHQILSHSAFFRNLSTAVPSELIMLYCLEHEILDWSVVVDLQNYAKNCLTAAYIERHTPVEPVYTDDAIYISMLHDMDIEKFKNTLLKQSCLNACYKKDKDEKQYSASALKLVENYSILREIKNRTANQRIIKGNNTVFLTDTVLRYNDYFPLDSFSFSKIMPNMAMSAETYFRFLNYRIVFPSNKDARSRRMYSMQYGVLPEAISENAMSYSEIMKGLTQAHRIDRHDILIALFYYYIMEKWRQGQPFIAQDLASAKKLWNGFFAFTNEKLKAVGHETLTVKNPVDAMLRIAMHAANPLECYNRIHELNVLSSLTRDSYNIEKYPDKKRIDCTLDALKASYQKLEALKIVGNERCGDIVRFVQDVKRAYRE